jgi:hypothetical protein
VQWRIGIGVDAFVASEIKVEQETMKETMKPGEMQRRNSEARKP